MQYLQAQNAAMTFTENDSLHQLEAFRCLHLAVRVKATRNLQLPPYRGSSLRGAFGLALKQSSCVLRRRHCNDCLLRSKCLYAYAFETPLTGASDELRRYSLAPHPFALRIQVNKEEHLQAGDAFSFGMTLVGRAAEFLPYFIHAFQTMGRLGIGRGRGTFDVERVEALDFNGQPVETVYENGTFKMPETFLGMNEAMEQCRSIPGDQLRVQLLTPLRLQYNGDLCRNLEFHVLVRNIVRRLENLTRFHCSAESSPELGAFIEWAEAVRRVGQKTHWYDWERYSKRQDRRMKLGGLMGEVSYRGDLAPFVPLLVMGSWVNIGKATSFGLGRYRIKGRETSDVQSENR